ncbi:hypothetical protein Ancab_026696 [Ancistrocladus abbreviatus]
MCSKLSRETKSIKQWETNLQHQAKDSVLSNTQKKKKPRQHFAVVGKKNWKGYPLKSTSTQVGARQVEKQRHSQERLEKLAYATPRNWQPKWCWLVEREQNRWMSATSTKENTTQQRPPASEIQKQADELSSSRTSTSDARMPRKSISFSL